MKLRITAALAGAMLLCSMSGCSFMELDLADALRPPKTMGDEAAIEQLISDTAKGSYTLKYPKNGSYRSAIIMKDLDGDETAEAVAFFRGKEETAKLHMLVMREDEGEWIVSGDFVTETTDVDCVDFARITNSEHPDILVGYTTYTPGVNFLSCYTFDGSDTAAVSAGQTYSAFYCGSLDAADRSQIIALSLYNADEEAKATMLEYDAEKRALFAKSSVSMDPGVVKYRHAAIGELENGVKGIAVDGSYATEEIVTQVIYYKKELALLRNPLYQDKTRNLTQRTLRVYSEDLNNDRLIDIPTVEKLPFAGADNASQTADRVTRCSFNTKDESLKKQSDYVVNFDYAFSIRIPEGWKAGTYTAVFDGRLTTFYSWEHGARGDLLFEIRAFDVTDWDKGKDTDGYTLIYRDNRTAYTLRNNTDSDSQFALTDNEIKTSFSVFSEIG